MSRYGPAIAPSVGLLVLPVDSTELSNTSSETNQMREWEKKADGSSYLASAILVNHPKGTLILYGYFSV